MKRLALVLFTFGASLATGMIAIAACSGDEAKLPDASSDAPPMKEAGPDCGPLPQITCFEGAPGKACGDTPQPLKAVDGGPPCPVYGCGPGTVAVSLCGCNAKANKVAIGADCPGADAGTD
jgi:hypothetical protein